MTSTGPLSAEEVVLAGLRQNLMSPGISDGAAGLSFRDATIDAPAVEAAVVLASRARVLPQMAAGLPPLVDEAQVYGLAEATDDFRRRAIARNAAILARTVEIIEVLERGSVDVIVFKGTFQQRQIHGDYFLRPVGDIDLLVRRRDYRRALDLLGTLSFRPAHPRSIWWDTFLGEHHLVGVGDTQWSVDLHHRLQQPGLPQPRDISAFFSDVCREPFRGSTIPVMHPLDLPLVIAMNLVKGLRTRSKTATHVCDLFVVLDRGVQSDTAAAFLHRARSQGLEGTALVALRLLQAFFPGSFPWLRDCLAPILPDLSDAQAAAIILGWAQPTDWPRRREILSAACLGRPIGVAREGTRYLASELSRVASEVRMMRVGSD